MDSRRSFVSRSRLMLLSVVAMLALSAGDGSRFAYSQAGNTDIVILSTGAIQGELAPCG